MKKGFTLIELLAVIVILGILATLSTVSVFRVIESQKKALLEEQVASLEDTAVTYIISSKKYLSSCGESLDLQNPNCYVKVSIKDLVDNNLFENKNNICDENGYVIVYKVKKNNNVSLKGQVSDKACHY